MLWFTLALLVAATLSDLRWRLIPHAVPMALLAGAVYAAAVGGVPDPGWTRLALGLLLGLAVGLLGFARGAFGGGDVKVIAALGAVVGPIPLLYVLFWTALAGGVVAVVVWMRGARELPYLPAITAGFVAAWLTGRLT